MTAGSWRPETEPTLPLRGDVFPQVAREQGLEPKGDPNPNAGSFYRSDQVSFATVGIPLHPEWNRGGTVRDMRILFETAPRVADAPEQRRGAAGHQFEEEWRVLYGKK